MEKIFKKITNLTVISYIILLLVFLLVFFIKVNADRTADRNLSTNILLGATIFAVAIPILLRTGFYNKSLKSKGLKQKEYYIFKVLIILSVFIGSLFALYGYYFPIFRYHLYISILVCIWGLYSIVPSENVYKKDLITYRVEK